MGPREITHTVYEKLVAHAGEQPPALRTWDGTTWGPRPASSTIVLKHPGALRALLLPPNDLVAAEAYVYDDIDIEGDIIHTLAFASSVEPLARNKLEAVRLARLLRMLPGGSRRREVERPRHRGRLHSPARDRRAVRAHYDTGNEFFSLFLDPQMVYSCAYFLSDEDDLATAQRRKLDVVCRKLELTPGQRLLDVGCGWGALAMHAAANYGVEVTGITLSLEQADLATRLVREAGLDDRVTIRVEDYRDVVGRFDAIASIGMFEHVGRKRLRTYFERINDLLAPGGVFLNHGITTRVRSRGRRRPTFINTYVFPDGELMPLETVVETAEAAGFEIRDVEALRTSYGRTLRHWLANLEANADAARAVAGEETYRIWRMYIAGSAFAFERGDLALYQLLLPGRGRPWRPGRHHLLAADDGTTLYGADSSRTGGAPANQ